MADKGRILIADDEESFRRATAQLLEREGYRCDEAGDALTAVQRLSHATYDLLIADIRMPGNARLELLGEMPVLAPGVPVILVTGFPSFTSGQRALDLPVVAYLVKPVEFGDLLMRVRNWLS
jgi:DNA-binding NtrC family response regulator